MDIDRIACRMIATCEVLPILGHVGESSPNICGGVVGPNFGERSSVIESTEDYLESEITEEMTLCYRWPLSTEFWHWLTKPWLGVYTPRCPLRGVGQENGGLQIGVNSVHVRSANWKKYIDPSWPKEKLQKVSQNTKWDSSTRDILHGLSFWDWDPSRWQQLRDMPCQWVCHLERRWDCLHLANRQYLENLSDVNCIRWNYGHSHPTQNCWVRGNPKNWYVTLDGNGNISKR